jgi:hypothetical protein
MELEKSRKLGKTMNLEILDEEFAVCKIKNLSGVNLNKDYTFLAKTEEEISLVCPVLNVPKSTIEKDLHWRCFRIQDQLEFLLIGILSGISNVLVDNKIGIFVVSTFNNDYVFVKSNKLVLTKDCLEKAGYGFTK